MINNYIEQIRLNHWLKNLLIFLPAVSSQNIFNSLIFFECILAFFAFGFIAPTFITLFYEIKFRETWGVK